MLMYRSAAAKAVDYMQDTAKLIARFRGASRRSLPPVFGTIMLRRIAAVTPAAGSMTGSLRRKGQSA